jgi:hypothetical protein
MSKVYKPTFKAKEKQEEYLPKINIGTKVWLHDGELHEVYIIIADLGENKWRVNLLGDPEDTCLVFLDEIAGISNEELSLEEIAAENMKQVTAELNGKQSVSAEEFDKLTKELDALEAQQLEEALEVPDEEPKKTEEKSIPPDVQKRQKRKRRNRNRDTQSHEEIKVEEIFSADTKTVDPIKELPIRQILTPGNLTAADLKAINALLDLGVASLKQKLRDVKSN